MDSRAGGAADGTEPVSSGRGRRCARPGQPVGAFPRSPALTLIESRPLLGIENLGSVSMWVAPAATGRFGPAHRCARSTRRMSEKVIARDVRRPYDGRGMARAEDHPGRGSPVPTRPRRARA